MSKVIRRLTATGTAAMLAVARWRSGSDARKRSADSRILIATADDGAALSCAIALSERPVSSKVIRKRTG